ncbi:5-dehydro-4-deoxy-D-glucuronate isomerase [Silvibacterium dinghuense]|uniref:4-deoxy-L-threo-5-hexosulose-uronate ketol-isomerase n=1 Tax=Silvibacterium dinghuense TaxID=1560006 RepID=A0A4Q1SJ42_9BACT|nr:5-dehydro-4-deoxy-D-glucuronate isomerase [Silvibacterium dinghuense]RXS97651.1 5-dehydro-4-deoxy-D-glucuronate isomerase [Silvibacterium dinghuense]GGH00842.1 4-deoxy-L-threo-5-hexosulose-uronate ketol-isomerase 2 [Silvibacterium dinghuense]
MRFHTMADPVRYPGMSTDELRKTFLVDELFAPGKLQLALTDLDRALVGGAIPLDETLTLPTPEELRAAYFLERRELGVLNIGGPGYVTVDDTHYPLSRLDTLYVGRGRQSVMFGSEDAAQPAVFYLLSYPAHADYPTAVARFAELTGTRLGTAETANARTIYKAIHLEGIRSSQLVMGFTLLDPGSVWNTMPPHTHQRRSEIYFYFDLDASSRVIHLMGPPQETRNLIVGDREIVLSPPWSVHCGAGTRNYGFCWGMGGENQDYSDMDPAPLATLR